MTKKEKNKIQELEVAAWESYCKAKYEYVIEHFPFGYGCSNAYNTLYTTEERDVRALFMRWKAYNFIALELEAGTQFSSIAQKYNMLTYEWLEGIGE